MATTLQDLRREAGYKSAREFAESLEIPLATYARYEQSPDKIPLKSAWTLADALKCSIDAVVGREHVDVDSMRGNVQKFYDELGEENKALFDDYCDYLKQRENTARSGARFAEMRKYERLSQMFESRFIDEAEREDDLMQLITFGTQDDVRKAFRDFVASKAQVETGSEEEIEHLVESLDKIMEAYDHKHHLLSRREMLRRIMRKEGEEEFPFE